MISSTTVDGDEIEVWGTLCRGRHTRGEKRVSAQRVRHFASPTRRVGPVYTSIQSTMTAFVGKELRLIYYARCRLHEFGLYFLCMACDGSALAPDVRTTLLLGAEGVSGIS